VRRKKEGGRAYFSPPPSTFHPSNRRGERKRKARNTLWGKGRGRGSHRLESDCSCQGRGRGGGNGKRGVGKGGKGGKRKRNTSLRSKDGPAGNTKERRRGGEGEHELHVLLSLYIGRKGRRGPSRFLKGRKGGRKRKLPIDERGERKEIRFLQGGRGLCFVPPLLRRS